MQKIFNLGKWTIRTLWEGGKLDLLRNKLKRFRYDILDISEIRCTGKGETASEDFIWSGKKTLMQMESDFY